MGVNVGGLHVEVLLESEAGLESVRPFDDGEVVVEVGNLFLEAIVDGVAAAEIRDAADGDLGAFAGEGIGNMLLIAIGPAEAEFVQHGGREAWRAIARRARARGPGNRPRR